MNTFKLEAGNTGKQFIFEFSFEDKLGIASNEPGSRYVSYKVYRNDKPHYDNEIFIWEGVLFTENYETFSLEFPDNINIVGRMKLSVHEPNDYIWLDARYGLESHFEGNILAIPAPTPPSE